MPLSETEHITKPSADVYVSEDVDLSVEQGEIHALLGENGAGKATLINILLGIYQADKGEICFKGRNVEFESPGEAIARGIGTMRQHFSLVKEMTVLDNVMLGLKRGGIMAGRRLAREKLTDFAAAYGLLVNPEAPVHALPVGEQQRVEILKALYQDASLPVLDKPIGVLMPRETENFFGALRWLRDKDYGIIIITHRLGKIMDTSDRITALCGDREIRSLVTRETTSEELLACMTGRELKTEREIREPAAGETALSLKDMCLHKKHSTKTSLDHVSPTICRGEILGAVGVEGSGRKGLVEIITGIRRIKSGQMEYQGKDVRESSVKGRLRTGTSYISGDRHGDSLVMDTTMEGNLISRDSNRKPFSRKMVLDHRQAEKRAREALNGYNIKASGKSDIRTPVKLMSGGNQRRVILSGKISREADLIVTNQPIRGLDIGAIRFVHETLLRQRDAGRYVLLISTDLDGILGVGGRMAVMYKGRIIGILSREEADVHKIGLLMGDIAKETTNE